MEFIHFVHNMAKGTRFVSDFSGKEKAAAVQSPFRFIAV